MTTTADLPSLGRRITVGVFMAALLAPAVAVGASGQVRSTVSTVVADPASWQEESNRLRAATPLWNGGVASYSTLLYLSGTSSNEGVGVVGRDGWMFLGDFANANMAQATSRRVLSTQEADAWAAVVSEQREWLATRGIPMVVVVGPAKWSVYPEKLPAWAADERTTSSFDVVQETHPELDLVDLRPALREAGQEHDTYSRLNSHWTDYGAYVGWRELAGRIDDALPGATMVVPGLEGVGSRDDGPNEFDSMMGVRAPNPWTYPELTAPLPDVAMVEDDGTSRTVPGDTETALLDLPTETRSTRAGNDLTALVLRDSMGDALSPYLQASFGRTVQVRHNVDDPAAAPNLQAWVEETQPDVVVFEMAERHFNSPLQDLESWHAANLFDRADASREAGWATATGAAGVEVTGDLGTDGSTRVGWAPGSGGDQVLRIGARSAGACRLTVALPDGSERALRVASGGNVLFAAVPAGTSSLELRTDCGQGLELDAVAVRPSR